MSSPGYITHVLFIRDYEKDKIIIKKGEIRSAICWTDHPGVGMSDIKSDGTFYKIWYDVYEDAY